MRSSHSLGTRCVRLYFFLQGFIRTFQSTSQALLRVTRLRLSCFVSVGLVEVFRHPQCCPSSHAEALPRR